MKDSFILCCGVLSSRHIDETPQSTLRPNIKAECNQTAAINCTPMVFCEIALHLIYQTFSGHQGESSLKRRIRSFSTSEHHRPKSTDPKVGFCFGFARDFLQRHHQPRLKVVCLQLVECLRVALVLLAFFYEHSLLKTPPTKSKGYLFATS